MNNRTSSRVGRILRARLLSKHSTSNSTISKALSHRSLRTSNNSNHKLTTRDRLRILSRATTPPTRH